MKWTAYVASVTVVVACCRTVEGERVPEDRETADYVVTGTVEKIYSRREGRRTEHLVQVLVEKVDARRGEGRGGGDAVKEGDRLYAYCFQVAKARVPIPEEGGHDAVPEEGQRVTAYLRWRHGQLQGNYPTWFDAAPQAAGRRK